MRSARLGVSLATRLERAQARTPVRCLALLVLALAGRVEASEIVLPEIGDSSQTVLSPSGEKEIGEAFMRELRANVALVEDQEVASYVQSLGYKLASHTGQSQIGFTFFVVDEPIINAFAAPGGFIGINSGLITTTQSESELAAVLAHEIVHVTQHHIARFIELQDRAMVPVLAGLVAAIAIGLHNPEAGAATAAAVQGGATQKLINFTRANEQEADRIGIQILADAGLDPRAMPIFFERLHEASRYYASPPEFLSTHPVTANRIAESRDRAERYPYRQYADSLAYHLVRAKLQVHAEPSPEAGVAKFRELLDTGKYVNLLGATYGYALALRRAGALGEAREVVELLLDKDPEQISFYVLQAEIELAAGNWDKALFVYQDNVELYPENRVLVHGYTDTLLRMGRAEEALEAIDRFARYNAMDAPLYGVAARAYDRLGDPRSAHASLAEHYYLSGKFEQATHQLELAMRAPSTGDYHTDAKVQARLKQLREEEALRKKRR